MGKYLLLLSAIVLIAISCDKKEEEPEYSGEIILSSEILQSGQSYVFYGFSFESGKISTYSLTSSVLPDLAAVHVELVDSVNIDLLGSDDQEAFYKNGIFPGSTEAEAYFNSYSEVIATSFQPIAYYIRENQVWTVQTDKNHFAKIWIKEISVKQTGQEKYADIRIQYQYQPDGSRIFDCNCN
jgi:hypothetical protein